MQNRDFQIKQGGYHKYSGSNKEAQILHHKEIYNGEHGGNDELNRLEAFKNLACAIFNTVLFLAVLLVGGLWVFRSMTKKEITLSAGIAAGIYLLIVLAQLYVTNFPLSWSVKLAYIQTWTSVPFSYLLKLTDNLTLSSIVSAFAPLLFIPFGRKTNT